MLPNLKSGPINGGRSESGPGYTADSDSISDRKPVFLDGFFVLPPETVAQPEPEIAYGKRKDLA